MKERREREYFRQYLWPKTSNKINRLYVTSQSQCGRPRKLWLFLSGRLRVGGVNVDWKSSFHLYNAALVAFSPTDSTPPRLQRSAQAVCAWLIARLYNNVRRRDSSFNLHYLHEGTSCYCIWRHTDTHLHLCPQARCASLPWRIKTSSRNCLSVCVTDPHNDLSVFTPVPLPSTFDFYTDLVALPSTFPCLPASHRLPVLCVSSCHLLCLLHLPSWRSCFFLFFFRF